MFLKDEIQYLSENRVRTFGEVFFDIFQSGKVGDFSKIHFLTTTIKLGPDSQGGYWMHEAYKHSLNGAPKPLWGNYCANNITHACHSSEQSPNYPKPSGNQLEPPKYAQNLQNRSKIEDFAKSSWNLTTIGLPRPRTSWSRDSCWIVWDKSKYSGS